MNNNVEIILKTNDRNSNEFKASKVLKEILIETLPKEAVGKITILSNVTLLGQRVKDLDLVVIGELRNCIVHSAYACEEDEDLQSVKVYSFCITIELKSHGAHGVYREGTDIYVNYDDDWHSVTKQSNSQMYALKNYFVNRIGESPFISNFIWLISMTSTEVKDLLSDGDFAIKSNILPNNFSFDDLIKILCYQSIPYKRNGIYQINNTYNCYAPPEELTRCFDFFSKAKEAIGELTRKKIEQLTRNLLSKERNVGEKMIVYRGRAGTGKTHRLLQTAINLAMMDDKRVLLLTYNNALVSDIRRILAFAEIPDGFDSRSASITTVHKYMYQLMFCVGLINKDVDTFLENYQELLEELWDYLNQDIISKEDIKKALSLNSSELYWEYILIDEGQDWNELERDVLVKIYGHNRILVADGTDQLIRNNKACNWSVGVDKDTVKLKISLRQKTNLIQFVNDFARECGMDQFELKSAKELVGGKVIITTRDYLNSNIHASECASNRNSGNSNYDYLFLVPPQLVSKTNTNGDTTRSFKKTREFKQHDIDIWDGTRSDLRTEYPVDLTQHRLIQYDSCRGLEGWSVVCLEFDRFLEYKESSFNDITDVDPLRLDTPEAQKKRFVNSWALLPLTRAIDTLIITLDNPNSIVGKKLRRIYEKTPDYIRWID